ncbi:hypothetical protein E3T55_02705 [Cryobacterium frigoriphilum]|uniref:Uncharacterized protein n=1 Tax=Cryobacterium frigoriphilum TaxID=1259150 RepID=A0A4R9AAD1_9MICO|nr:hypothetical protein [Cryobacterium frigoriphilum]TFD54722.1 hypothetical protein E3T55_02705 [Cryobacterium frigoriphilum]
MSDPILLNERAMVRMLVPVQWILRRVGTDGIRLTKAGHLPPAVVIEASTQLDWGWPIEVNREVHIRPLGELRAHLRDVGLLRVSKGTLLLTVRGRTLVESPRELWRYLAATIHHSRTPGVSDATRLLLLYVATRTLDSRSEYLEVLGRGLGSLGWVVSAESGMSGEDAADELIAPKWRLLTRLGVFEGARHGFGRTETVTVGGAAFARAALKVEVPAIVPA